MGSDNLRLACVQPQNFLTNTMVIMVETLPVLVGNLMMYNREGGYWEKVEVIIVITSTLLPVPALSIIHHQLLPTRAGNGLRW